MYAVPLGKIRLSAVGTCVCVPTTAVARPSTYQPSAWDNREVFEFIDDAKYLARPANFPEGTPGKGLIFVNCNGTEVAVINLQG
ncbi:YmdB family metallophosphoesterase, partial [Bacillus sp. HC-Mk]